MPDGAIQQLFPLSGFSRDEAYLEPGQTHLVTTICYVAAPPFGNEVLKLFATPAPIDFDPILTTRGPARSSVQGAGPLEQWLAEIHTGARSAVGSVPGQHALASRKSKRVILQPKRPVMSSLRLRSGQALNEA